MEGEELGAEDGVEDEGVVGIGGTGALVVIVGIAVGDTGSQVRAGTISLTREPIGSCTRAYKCSRNLMNGRFGSRVLMDVGGFVDVVFVVV